MGYKRGSKGAMRERKERGSARGGISDCAEGHADWAQRRRGIRVFCVLLQLNASESRTSRVGSRCERGAEGGEGKGVDADETRLFEVGSQPS